ncbi:MAG: NUDIX domain-containing protein, partial [Gemmatimonadota bacterium]
WLDAARRELGEELGVDVVAVAGPVYRSRDPGSRFEIVFVPAEIRGEPRAIEHDELRWVDLTAPATLPLAPADAAFVRFRRAGPGPSAS